MIDKNVFREYDIRGVYPTNINEEFAYVLGRAFGSYVKTKYQGETVVVGRDIRLSSPSLSQELIKGLLSTGINVTDLGLVTSPMCAYGTKVTNNPYTMMVTASHNPKDDNGFKFGFDNDGMARGEMIADFRDYLFEGIFEDGSGTYKTFDVFPYYGSFIQNDLNFSRRLKVVFDPANATAAPFLKSLLDVLNIDYILINGEPDGNFPTHHPDPSIESNLEQLKAEVLRNNADLGIGYDGDADRLGVIDELGNFIAIDKIMAVMIRDIINKVDNKKFVFDVKSSKALEDEIIKLGGEPICYRVGGHSYIRTKVNSDKLPFGGELSGHIVYNDRFPGIDDGIYSSLRLIELLSNSGKKMSELLEGINKYYNTPEIKVGVRDDNKFQIVESVKEYCLNKGFSVNDVDGVRVTFSDGWALIRASNTGPNLTLRFEATTEERLAEIKNEYETLINSLK